MHTFYLAVSCKDGVDPEELRQLLVRGLCRTFGWADAEQLARAADVRLAIVDKAAVVLRREWYEVTATLFDAACADCRQSLTVGRTYIVHATVYLRGVTPRTDEALCHDCHARRLDADPSIVAA